MIYEFDGLTSWIGFAQPVHTMSETFFLPIIYRKLKFYDFGDIIMMSRCLLGIKRRAELNFEISNSLSTIR